MYIYNTCTNTLLPLMNTHAYTLHAYTYIHTHALISVYM